MSRFPDVDGGSDLTCDALPGSCSEDDASLFAFTANSCPNLETVLTLACPDAETVYAVCGSGGVYTSFACKRPECEKEPCDAGHADAKTTE